MIIVKEKKIITEEQIKHGQELAKADVLAKKADMLKDEIFNVFDSSDGTRDVITALIENIYMKAIMAFLYNRVLILRPNGVKIQPNSPQAEDIALQAAKDTQAAIVQSHMKKYVRSNDISTEWSISKMVKYAKVYFMV